jgi:hypothetical protein
MKQQSFAISNARGDWVPALAGTTWWEFVEPFQGAAHCEKPMVRADSRDAASPDVLEY